MATNSEPMYRWIATFMFTAIAGWMAAQTAPGKYWVRFTDKSATPYSLANPSAFLSPECIERRLRLGIGFDERDLPVDPAYIEQVLSTDGIALHHRSRWFNSITVRSLSPETEAAAIEAISALPFVAEIRRVESSAGHAPDKWEEPANISAGRGEPADSAVYGASFRQIDMLHGTFLHALGYRGEGVTIAILDAGWTFGDLLPAFGHVRDDGRLLGTRDLVNGGSMVYGGSSHGTFVWSHIAGIIPDSLYGTAPMASFYLLRSEDPGSEYLVEEDNWVAAAEYCDSLGVDIINSSLGYSRFDDPSMDHSYADMNGESTRISIAADIAAEKGILVVNSAGNSGDDPWHYITAPADGDEVLAVGAVNADEQHAWFSSYGPSSDGDVKPNVVAMGQQTVFADLDSTIRKGNGTSFSAPIIAGLAACLWQAFPEANNREIRSAIERSAHLYHAPNDSMGYGIPDFQRAFHLLREQQAAPRGSLSVRLFPNPCVDHLTITVDDAFHGSLAYRVLDATGREVYAATGSAHVPGTAYHQVRLPVDQLAPGHYYLEIDAGGERDILPFIRAIRP